MALAQTTASDTEAADLRGYGRATVAIKATLEIPRGRFRCTLLDLSLEGARIETDQPLQEGDSLWLKLYKLRVFGTVQWKRGTTIGVHFDERLPKTLVMSLLGHDIDPEELQELEAVLAARDWVVGSPAPRPKNLRLGEVLGSKSWGLTKDSEPASHVPDFLKETRRTARERSLMDKRVLGLFGAAAVLGSLLGLGSALFF